MVAPMAVDNLENFNKLHYSIELLTRKPIFKNIENKGSVEQEITHNL